METKTKILIVTMIALFAVLISATSVNAVEVTEETLQQMVDVIPNEITLDISEKDATKIMDKTDFKSNQLLEQKIKDIWKNNNLNVSEDINILIKYSGLYGVESVNAFHNIAIDISKNTENQVVTKTKNISLKYNNSDQRNSADEQYVKNLKIAHPTYIPITESQLHNLENNFVDQMRECVISAYKKINDSSISFEIGFGAGYQEFGIFPGLGEGATTLGIFKNDILYDVLEIPRRLTSSLVPVIDVPSNISKDNLNNYLVQLMISFGEKDLQDSNIDIIEGASLNNVSIPNGYTIKPKDFDIEYVAIINFKTENVNLEESETNIKLEATTDIVPSNTVLEIKPIEKSNITVLEDTVNNFVAYDITLKSNGVEIQPNGKVKIKIPVPAEFDTSKLVVYRIDGNNKIKYNVTVETIDGKKYAVFETDHFSTYILGEMKETVNNNAPTSNKGELDDTPKTGATDIIKYILPITLMSAVGIVALRKKKETK